MITVLIALILMILFCGCLQNTRIVHTGPIDRYGIVPKRVSWENFTHQDGVRSKIGMIFQPAAGPVHRHAEEQHDYVSIYNQEPFLEYHNM